MKKLKAEIVSKTDDRVWAYWKAYGHFGKQKCDLEEGGDGSGDDSDDAEHQSVYVLPWTNASKTNNWN